MESMQAAIGYTRVSTSGQASSGLGLAAQRDAIESFARAEGFTITAWHTDAETGKGSDALDRRPGLAAALKAARAAKAPVVVAKLDRLSRTCTSSRPNGAPGRVCRIGIGPTD